MKEKIIINVTGDIYSNQEWTSDPDLIQIELKSSFVEKAEKCIAFMQEHDVAMVKLYGEFGYELFTEDDAEGEEGAIVVDGEQYVPFEPEYRLSGCDTLIFKDGYIKASMPFKHTNEELWCELGRLDRIKEKFSAAVEELQAA